MMKEEEIQERNCGILTSGIRIELLGFGDRLDLLRKARELCAYGELLIGSREPFIYPSVPSLVVSLRLPSAPIASPLDSSFLTKTKNATHAPNTVAVLKRFPDVEIISLDHLMHLFLVVFNSWQC